MLNEGKLSTCEGFKLLQEKKSKREGGCIHRYTSTGESGKTTYVIVSIFLVKHDERLSVDCKGLCWKFEEKEDAKCSPLENKKKQIH